MDLVSFALKKQTTTTINLKNNYSYVLLNIHKITCYLNKDKLKLVNYCGDQVAVRTIFSDLPQLATNDSNMSQRNKNDNIEEDSESLIKNELLKQCNDDESPVSDQHHKKKHKKRKIKHEQSDSDFTELSEKKIKTEIMSDIETSKKHKKKKHKQKFPDCSINESYLSIRVKEETFTKPSPIKPKKNKYDLKTSKSPDGSVVTSDSEINNSSKKKKRKKRKNDSFTENVNSEKKDVKPKLQSASESEPAKYMSRKKKLKKHVEKHEDMVVDDYFSAGETQIQSSDIRVGSTQFNEEIRNKSTSTISKQTDTNGHHEDDSGTEQTINKVESFKHKLDNYNLQDNYSSSDSSGPYDRLRDNTEDSMQNKASIENERTHKSISERIIFEGDEDDQTERQKDEHAVKIQTRDSNYICHSSSNMKNHLKRYDNLKINSTSLPNASIISQDDDIWLIKCPHEVTINTFQDIDLSIDSKCKIKVNRQTYEGVMEEDHNRLAILSQDSGRFVIINMEVQGSLQYHRKIPKCPALATATGAGGDAAFIALPETRRRHPLLGADFKRALRLPAAVRARLRQDEPDRQPTEKNKPKDSTPDPHAKLVEKRKRKRKHIEDELDATIKSKRVKQEPDSFTAWESEKAIEESLFNF